MAFVKEPLKNFLPQRPEDKADCLKQFEHSFAEHVTNIFEGSDQNSADMKYRLRHDLLTMDFFSTLNNIQFNGRSVFTNRPDRFQNCARLTTCTSYHFFSIKEIFNKMCETNTPSFTCTKCNGPQNPVTRTDQIIPDYFCYLYFTISQGLVINLNIEREDKAEIFQDQKTEIYKNDNKVYNTKDKKIITVSFDNCKDSFKEIAMQKVYEIIKSQKENLTNIRISNARNREKFQTLGTTSFGLISLITSSRIKAGVLHEDCEHKEVYIFDLEGMIIGLFSQDQKNVKKQFKCLYCRSVFTKENIYAKATYFSKVNYIMLAEPYCSGRVYYYNNKLQQRAEENEYIKRQEMLTMLAKETYPNMNAEEISKKVKDGLNKLVIMAASFWNKQDKQKSQKYFQKTVKKVAENKTQKQFLMKIDYKKLFYPVRCKKCSSLECADLWEYLVRMYKLLKWENKEKFMCFACKQYEFDDENEKNESQIYLDLEIYTLMQLGVVNIAYDFDLKRWIPDINNIAFKELTNMNSITYVVNFLKENGKQGNRTTLKYYKAPFSLEGSPKNSECFIIDKCNNINDNVGKYAHVIFASKNANILSFKCPSCKAEPENILELMYDRQLGQYINQGYTEWDPVKGFIKPNPKPGPPRPRIKDNELEFIQEMFKKELNDMKKSNKDASAKWNRNLVTKYAGGVDLFTDRYVDMLRVN